MKAEAGAVLRGRYRLQQRLGGGGSAETWLGRDEQSATDVVLKLLPFAGGTDWKMVELLEREARVLANLRHPAIPRFVELLREDEGLCLVQEFVPGQSLDRVLAARGRLPPADVVDIGIEVAAVLEHIHGLLPPIVHRDLKPANLVLGEPGSGVPRGKIHVIDFGAVRDILRPAHETPEGGDTIVGTYGYMPIEQFAGQAGPPSDVYALGATLVHLLTGQPPWSLPRKDGRLDLARTPAMPAGLRRILARATEPNLAGRTASATRLRQELEAFRAGRAIPGEEPAQGTLARSWRRLRVPLFALSVAALAFWLTRPSTPPAGEDNHHACGRWPAAALDRNLLANPGFDGPCGWGFRPSAASLLAAGPRGQAVALRERGQLAWQEINLAALAPRIRSGTCRAMVRGSLRSEAGSGRGGRPYLHGVAKAEPTAAWIHLGNAAPTTSPSFTAVEQIWDLPAGTKTLRLELGRSDVSGCSAWLEWLGRGTAWFDDVSVVVKCDGG